MAWEQKYRRQHPPSKDPFVFFSEFQWLKSDSYKSNFCRLTHLPSSNRKLSLDALKISAMHLNNDPKTFWMVSETHSAILRFKLLQADPYLRGELSSKLHNAAIYHYAVLALTGLTSSIQFALDHLPFDPSAVQFGPPSTVAFKFHFNLRAHLGSISTDRFFKPRRFVLEVSWFVLRPRSNVRLTRRLLRSESLILVGSKAPGSLNLIGFTEASVLVLNNSRSSYGGLRVRPWSLNGSSSALTPCEAKTTPGSILLLQYHSTSFRPSKHTILTSLFEPNLTQLQPFEFSQPASQWYTGKVAHCAAVERESFFRRHSSGTSIKSARTRASRASVSHREVGGFEVVVWVRLEFNSAWFNVKYGYRRALQGYRNLKLPWPWTRRLGIYMTCVRGASFEAFNFKALVELLQGGYYLRLCTDLWVTTCYLVYKYASTPIRHVNRFNRGPFDSGVQKVLTWFSGVDSAPRRDEMQFRRTNIWLRADQFVLAGVKNGMQHQAAFNFTAANQRESARASNTASRVEFELNWSKHIGSTIYLKPFQEFMDWKGRGTGRGNESSFNVCAGGGGYGTDTRRACKTNKPGYYGKGSVEVSKPANNTDSPTRRLAISADKRVTQPFAGIDTVYDEAKEVVKTVNGKEVKEIKKWKYFQLSRYKYITCVGLKEQVDDVFNIYAATRYPSAVGVLCPLRVLGVRLWRPVELCPLRRPAFTFSLCCCVLSTGGTLRFRAPRFLLRAPCARSAYTYCFPITHSLGPRYNAAQGCYDYVNAGVWGLRLGLGLALGLSTCWWGRALHLRRRGSLAAVPSCRSNAFLPQSFNYSRPKALVSTFPCTLSFTPRIRNNPRCTGGGCNVVLIVPANSLGAEEMCFVNNCPREQEQPITPGMAISWYDFRPSSLNENRAWCLQGCNGSADRLFTGFSLHTEALKIPISKLIPEEGKRGSAACFMNQG
ncbi:hypothetical protein B0H16DRAFT_1695825 [Mycena metata]|uniref:Uncharacterized protein n=1 Tax=Mycena metata TaxID=1033252 RepID=A0AAD7I405_9AGAR|nr:hypothetical protein B0H16DRAFT_1695825 [Mycena metata]